MLSQEDLTPIIDWNFSLSPDEKAFLVDVAKGFGTPSVE